MDSDFLSGNQNLRRSRQTARVAEQTRGRTRSRVRIMTFVITVMRSADVSCFIKKKF